MTFKKRLKRHLKNKDIQVLLENFISLSSLQLVGMILPLITLPYVLRVLDIDKYGILMLASSLVAYFQSLTDYSFRITATRDVAVFKQNKKKLSIIYSKVITIKIIFLLISLGIITLIVWLYPPFFEERLVFGLTAVSLVGYALFPEWFFQGIEEMKYITFLNLGIKFFFTICVFLFIKEKSDYWIYALLNSAGLLGAGVLGQYILVKQYKLRFHWLKAKMIVQTITGNFPIFVNQFLPTLYNNTSTFLLGIFATPNLVGMYAAIKKIVDLASTLLNLVSRVFFPLLNRRKDAFHKYKKLMMSLACALVIIMLLLHRIVFWYLDIDYSNAFAILTILAIGIIGYATYDVWGLNYFIIKREDKMVMKNTITASILGFILAFPLIYFYGIIGAAINLTLSRWMMGGGLLYKYLKINK